MPVDPLVLEVIACPEDRGPLVLVADEDVLYNPRLRRRYPVRDDIAVLLVERGEAVDEAEHRRLLAKAGEREPAEASPAGG